MFKLLQKLESGGEDSAKVIKMLSKNVFISEDWVFIDDETYFRKVSSIIEEII